MAENLEIIVRMTDKATSILGGIKSALGGLGGLAGGIAGKGLELLSENATKIGGTLMTMGKEAAQLTPIKDAFEAIATASGRSSEEMIRALRESSSYMIKDSELMKSYSLASQLVSDEFANNLPAAMGALGKVAAATGQDMGYMMDSLVRGVGRMSPMILDNLGIQVSLSDANQTYADSIGKTVKELTKSEQQTALMNQVMEKLNANTANMATAVDPFEQFSVTMDNLKETASMAIGETVLPLFTGLMEKVVEFVQGNGFQVWLSGAVEWLGNLGEQIGEFLSSESFQEWLQGVGEFITTTVVPALQSFGEFIKSPLAPTIGAVSKFIAAELIPALKSAADWFSVNILPPIQRFVTFISEVLTRAIQGLRTAWNTNFLGIRDVVSGLWTHIQLVMDLIKAVFEGDWRRVGEIVRAMVKNIIDTIKNVDWLGLGKSIIQGIGKGLKAAASWLWETLGDILKGAVDFAKGLLQIASPSQVMADQIGRQMAAGVGVGLEKGLRGLQSQAKVGFGGLTASFSAAPMLAPAYAGVSGSGGSSMQVVVQYAPMVSFADEFELEQRLRPVIQRAMRQR